mgnify:FL=1
MHLLIFLLSLHLFGATPTTSSPQCTTIIDRVDCSSGVGSQHAVQPLTPEQCTARGCCYEKSTTTDGTATAGTCYYPAEGRPITTIHMINSNHFDAGYANVTADVINLYFDVYFQRAADVGAQLRSPLHAGKPGSGPLKWMTFSWLISLYFDCPPSMGLHCPTEQQRQNITHAIQHHDIVWPAFPHNAELATGDPALLAFGVRLSQDLARRFNASAPNVLSTRDVPGMPRAALSLLKEAGVTALSEGMNGRMVPVNVPPAFRWQSLDKATVMPTLWHWHGYGQIGEPGNPIRIPGSDDALCYCWRGDNEGPPLSAFEVLDNAIAISTNAGLPNVTVVSSTLSDYVDEITLDQAWQHVPVVTQDLSDTWIWGVGSDPVKVQQMRAINRARTKCESIDAPTFCGHNDLAYYNFSRLALKNMEHTWGVSVAHYGPESDQHWSNVEFHRQLNAKEPHLQYMVRSWVEQRTYGVEDALAALPVDHPALVYAKQELEEMASTGRPNPVEEGFQQVGGHGSSGVGIVVRLEGGDQVRFAADGSIDSLMDNATQTQWSGKDHALGLFQYQSLVLDDFLAWQSVYLINGTGGTNEYGKPASFMKSTPTPIHQLVSPVVQTIWQNHREVLVQMTMANDTPHEVYGAPQEIWARWTWKSPTTVTCRLLLLNKTATRLPEAGWFRFNPTVVGAKQDPEQDAEQDPEQKEYTWTHSVLGEWSAPNDIAQGASKGLHYVDEQGGTSNPQANGKKRKRVP